MGRKKASATKEPVANMENKVREFLEQAKNRLPSSRAKVRCEGCFAPRNTLTVKAHKEKIWSKDQIKLEQDRRGVLLPCFFCKEERYLSLSGFSRDVLETDLPTYDMFVLLKDEKYNALVGIEYDKTLDLGDWMT